MLLRWGRGCGVVVKLLGEQESLQSEAHRPLTCAMRFHAFETGVGGLFPDWSSLTVPLRSEARDSFLPGSFLFEPSRKDGALSQCIME